MLPGQHPLILLPGISYAELRALLDYMYYGEVRGSKYHLAIKLIKQFSPGQYKQGRPSKPDPFFKGT